MVEMSVRSDITSIKSKVCCYRMYLLLQKVGVEMDWEKIKGIVQVIIVLYGLTSGQAKQLENYAKNNLYTWQAELRREEEIEVFIRNEAKNISGQ